MQAIVSTRYHARARQDAEQACRSRRWSIDAYFDTYLGVIEKIRVYDGEIKQGSDQISFMRKGGVHPVNEIGIFTAEALMPQDSTEIAGEFGLHRYRR
jgi:translation elongation factor EF-4